MISSLACVEAGWAEDQLIAGVGEPHERRDDSWIYWWIESEEQGGPYFLAYVNFRDSVVIDIVAHAGHRSSSGALLD